MISIISGIAQREIEIALNNFNFGIKSIQSFKESVFDISGNLKFYGRKIIKKIKYIKIIKISNELFLYKTNDNKIIRITWNINSNYEYIFYIKILN